MSNINRANLITAINLARPALSTQNFIPALTHFRLNKDLILGYNDITCIAVNFEHDLACCLPGDLLIKTLGSFGSSEVDVAYKDGNVTLKAGKAKMKLPVLPLDSHPYEDLDLDWEETLTLTEGFLKGLSACLISVGNDPTHPAQMGVTLEPTTKGAALFSTDNFTVSRYQTDVKLERDQAYILPTFFCQQLLTLARAFPKEELTLRLSTGLLEARFGKAAWMQSKTLVDVEPLDFPHIFDKHCKLAGFAERNVDIPAGWDAAFERALLVQSAELDKLTKVEILGDALKLQSSSPSGEALDSLPYEAADHDPEQEIHLDPSLVLRGSKVCTKLLFNEKSLTLTSDDTKFVHLISYCSK